MGAISIKVGILANGAERTILPCMFTKHLKFRFLKYYLQMEIALGVYFCVYVCSFHNLVLKFLHLLISQNPQKLGKACVMERPYVHSSLYIKWKR